MLERSRACARWSVAVSIFLARVLVLMQMCARARPFQRGSIVLLDHLEAELRCYKADPKSSIRSIGTLIRFIVTDGSSHTLGSFMMQRAFSCRVDVKTSTSLSVVRQTSPW